MFQASILESLLQKCGPSLRIPAVFHSKQMVAAAIWTHTSLIEDIFQELLSAAPTHGAGTAFACANSPAALSRGADLCLLLITQLPNTVGIQLLLQSQAKDCQNFASFSLMMGRGKRKFTVLSDSSCNPQPLATTRISYLGMTWFQTFAAVQNWKRTHCWHP